MDGSGKISASELKAVLGQIQISTGSSIQSLNNTSLSASDQQCNSMLDDSVWSKMISDADIDGDGEISLEEFEKLMTALLYNQNQKLNSARGGPSPTVSLR